MNKNNLSNVSVSKFDIKGGNILYAKLLWQPNEHDLFHIKIYDNETTWTGKFSNDFATKFRDHILESEEKYYSNIKNALAGEQTLYTYEFNVVQGDDKSNTFRWIKKYEDGASVIHGSVPVQRDTPESKDELVNILMSQNKDLKTKIECITRKNEQIDKDLGKCKHELEKFVDIKTSLETSLYGKFVQLLNAKKRRIELLEENLLKFEEPNKNSCDNELD